MNNFSPRTRNNRITNEGSSTEVGSEDLSSDEDTDNDEDMSDFGSDFSSGTATECEFTDSEGRPNPFHKQLEVPDIVVEPGSPAVQPRHKRGTVLDQGCYSMPVVLTIGLKLLEWHYSTADLMA